MTDKQIHDQVEAIKDVTKSLDTPEKAREFLTSAGIITPMKQYLFFAGNQFYPMGGIYDYLGKIEDITKPDEYYLNDCFVVEGAEQNGFSWYHIVDPDTMEIIRQDKSYGQEFWITKVMNHVANLTK